MGKLNKLMNLGTRDDMSFSEVTRIRMINGSLLAASINIIIYNILFFILGYEKAVEMSLFRFLCAGLILMSFFISKKGHMVLVSHILMLASISSVFHAAYFYLGPTYGFQKFFIVFAMVPFIYFTSKHWYYRVGYTILCLSLYFFLERGSYNYLFTESYIDFSSRAAAGFNFTNVAVGFLTMILVMFIYDYLLKYEEKQLRQALASARYHAEYDYLTDTWNRRCMSEFLRDYIDSGKKACLIMWDIDNFKGINDVYGHAMGDDVLVSVCKDIKQTIRSQDKFARWGGEEFLMLFDETSLKEGQVLAETIRKQVSDLRVIDNYSVTISLGVTEVKDHDSFRELLKRVDELMYKAKANGKNQYVSG